MLKLMYITPRADVASVAMKAGVNRIFVDMERLGKAQRQGGMDTVQSQHSLDDIRAIKQIMLPECELLVRTNPIHEGLAAEVDDIIACGADILMLPYFHSAEDLRAFVSMVDGRAKLCALLETRAAAECVAELTALSGVDEFYVGLNDLHLDYGLHFMFEPMVNGLLEGICDELRAGSKSFGFGGIARVGEGAIPAERIMREHKRLGSTAVILSRTFCRIDDDDFELEELSAMFEKEVAALRAAEQEALSFSPEQLVENREHIRSAIAEIVERKKNN